MVSPPDDILKKGAEKFKCCIVGQFTKATLPFRRVKEIANTVWNKRGLILVSQKNDSTFVFKFNSINEKNVVLSKGTWYFDQRPVVLTNWGSSVGVLSVLLQCRYG